MILEYQLPSSNEMVEHHYGKYLEVAWSIWDKIWLVAILSQEKVQVMIFIYHLSSALYYIIIQLLLAVVYLHMLAGVIKYRILITWFLWYWLIWIELDEYKEIWEISRHHKEL